MARRVNNQVAPIDLPPSGLTIFSLDLFISEEDDEFSTMFGK
jgi:hypothetical protein